MDEPPYGLQSAIVSHAVDFSSVYWRRRILVAVILLAVVAIFVSCVTRSDDAPTKDKKSSTVKKDTEKKKEPEKDVPAIQDGTKEHPFYPVPGPPPEGYVGT